MITGATYKKVHHLTTRERLDAFEALLLTTLAEAGWNVQAWSIFSNHYHLIAHCPEEGGKLARVLQKVHSLASRAVNAEDGTPGRTVWYQYHDSELTFAKSYCARLNYFIQNPVRHGLVEDAYRYRWCSARWFEESGDTAWVRTIHSFPTDSVNVSDDYQCLKIG